MIAEFKGIQITLTWLEKFKGKLDIGSIMVEKLKREKVCHRQSGKGMDN